MSRWHLLASQAVFLGIVCPLLMILDGLLSWRLRRARIEDADAPAPNSTKERVAWALAVIAAEFPLLRLAPPLLPEKLWGDTETHARMGRDLALYGLDSGWLDGLLAGFPFAQHYPPLPWLSLALEVALGLSPVRAVQWLGWTFLFLTPLVVYFCLLEVPRVRPALAAMGAGFVALISPYNPFFGGFEVFFSVGLISQTMGLPLVLLWMRSVLRGDGWGKVVLWSILAAASHPQLSVAGVLFLGFGVVAAGSRALLTRFLWGAVMLGVTALGLYGQGMVGLRVPFGWPDAFGWRHVGFTPDRLIWWLEDGDLFDQGGSGVMTNWMIAALLLALPRLRRPEVRGAFFALVLGLLVSVSGPSLPKLGMLGELALKFIQPLRFVALLPIAAAVLIVVVTEALARNLAEFSRLRARPLPLGWVRGVLVAASAICLIFALPPRLAYVRTWPDVLRRLKPPPGYDADLVKSWLSEPAEGRVWYDAEDESFVRLFTLDGLSLDTPRQIGATGAVGGHVGVHLLAFNRLEPSRPGSVRRAEALGVRHLLWPKDEVPSEWRELHASEAMRMLVREGGGDLWGVGCITKRYSGDNRALGRKLYAELRTSEGADHLLDPARYIEIEWTKGEVRESEVPLEGCSSEGAQLRPLESRPGFYRAEIESDHPVDVVLRIAYFQNFRVTMDGNDEPRRAVAPGFVSLRVPAGRHTVVVESRVWPGMLPSFGPAALILLLLAGARSRAGSAWLSRIFRRGQSRVSMRPSV